MTCRTTPTLCRFPAPHFCLDQRVKTTDQEEGVVRGFCYYLIPPHPGCSPRPGWHYFIRFDTPKTFTDTVHEDDLEGGDEAANPAL